MSALPMPSEEPAAFAQDEVKPTDAYFAQPGAPRGQSHDYGVVWRGPWERRVDGTSIASRRYLRALAVSGVPVRLQVAVGSFRTDDGYASIPTEGDIGDEVLAEVGNYRDTHIRHVTAWIDHIVPSARALRAILWPGTARHNEPELYEAIHPFRVALTVWEREACSREVGSLLTRFGQCWVPCEANRRALLAGGVPASKIHVVPHPYPPFPGRPTARSTNDGVFLFYNVAKWEPRKNQHAMLGAFLRAFGPEDPVVLLLKTSGFGRFLDYPEGPAESLQRWLEDPAVRARGWTATTAGVHVRLHVTPMTDAEMWSLHLRGDVYVTASHGEAWDLPAFDALVAGARLIHTGFGGSEDYAPSDAIRLSAGGAFERVPAAYAWAAGAQWATVEPDRIEAAFRQAYAEREAPRLPFDKARYSFRTVGEQMKGLLAQIGPL